MTENDAITAIAAAWLIRHLAAMTLAHIRAQRKATRAAETTPRTPANKGDQ